MTKTKKTRVQLMREELQLHRKKQADRCIARIRRECVTTPAKVMADMIRRIHEELEVVE